MPEPATLSEAAYEAAKRFLELIAIVDDGPFGNLPAARATVTPPVDALGGAQALVQPQSFTTEDAASPIDYEGISRAASAEGVFCALVRPDKLTEEGAGSVASFLAKADIIVLDWRIVKLQDGQYAKWIIRAIQLQNPDRKRQIICIYSDFPTPIDALEEIAVYMGFNKEVVKGGQIETPSLIVTWRSKTGVDGFPKTDSEELPRELISEFAFRHTGLVPLIAMDALSAVRSNTLPILERYSKDADQGFVMDCVLLGGKGAVAPAVRAALADDLTISAENDSEPDRLSKGAVTAWLSDSTKRLGEVPPPIKGANNLASQDKLADMVVGSGTEDDYKAMRNNGGKRRDLANSFFETGDATVNFKSFQEVYARFSSLLATQFWPSNMPARLTLGTIVSSAPETYAVCIQPSCDSVRLKADTDFPLLAISEDPSGTKESLAIPVVDENPKSFYLTPKIPGVKNVKFIPSPGVKTVLASSGVFPTVVGPTWRYVSQLRTSHAHRVLQALTDNAGRIGVSEGELGSLLAKGK